MFSWLPYHYRKGGVSMFGFGKKKLTVVSPAAGRILDITEVPDEVFSTKMMGDGFAVEPESDDITAPCAGKVVLVAGTRHAVALEKDGVQLLIHMGLDTVELGGKGFEVFVKQGDEVQQGTLLAHMDRAFVKSQGKGITTMVVLTNMDEKVKKLEKHLDCPEKLLNIEVK